MATKHIIKSRYPAPAATVMKMMTDRAFHEAKLAQLGLTSYEILDCSYDGKQFSIKIERKVPIQIPGMKKSAGESTVINEEKWDVKSRTGSVTAQPVGMPVDVSSVTALVDEEEGCVVTFNWTVHAKIPLVGGQLEKMVIKDMETRSADETRVAISLLPKYR